MSQRLQFTTAQLIARSLTPSGASAFICILLAILLVAANLVLQSVDIGTALPGVLDGQWAIAYTENVVQPLTELLSSNTLNKILIAALWGTAGFIVYIGFEYAIHWYKNLHESRTNIRMARGGTIERPLTSNFWTSVFWRIGVIVAAIIFLILVQPLLRDAMGIADVVLLNSDLVGGALRSVRAAAEWALLMHGLVVFLRLYTMRTRLFGDDKLY